MGRLVRVPKRASDDLAIAGLEDMLPHGLGGAEDQQIATETDNYFEPTRRRATSDRTST
jgi:hypothetical protein